MHDQLKNHFGTEFPKMEIFDGTHIAKKGNFDGLYKQPKNHFGSKLLKKEFLMGPTLSKAEDTAKQLQSLFVNQFQNCPNLA